MVWQPNPPRDAGGSVLPHDDPVTISGEWRFSIMARRAVAGFGMNERVYPDLSQMHSAFSTEGSRSMSVDMNASMLEEGLPSTALRVQGRKGVVRITAARPASCNFWLVPEPIPGIPPLVGFGRRIPRSPRASRIDSQSQL